MMEEDKSKLVEVYQGTLWEAELLKGLLKDRGIDSVIQNGLLVNVTLPETAVPVKIVVNEADYEGAMTVVREREKAHDGE